MSSMLCSQGMVLVTAMAAVSGTVILLAFRLQKSLPPSSLWPVDQSPQPSQQALRSCISTDGKRRERRKKKKRVHFAEDVVDPRGDGEEFRRQHGAIVAATTSNNSCPSPPPPPPPPYYSSSPKFKKGVSGNGAKERGVMPANRVALYNGILRDRIVHRLAYSSVY